MKKCIANEKNKIHTLPMQKIEKKCIANAKNKKKLHCQWKK
jgi:hypothetical protein